jgi:glycosyltransferase involved in cell wall biosynthesis
MRHDPSGEPARPAGVVLYVGSRLPALSETFVYREMLGLRTLGRATLAASLYPPRQFSADPELTALAAETFVIYTSANMLKLPMAVACRPLQMLIAVGDALRADHPSWRSRLKHIVQAGMGLQAARQLRGRRIEHVHAHMANAPAMVALYLARGLGVPFSFTGHAADLFVQRAALGFKLNQASFVACISQWHRSFYQAIVPLDQARLPVVRCSVTIPAVVQPERNELVAVARLIPKKGIDLLLRAFAGAPALSDWTLRVLGDGDDRARLESLAQELHVADRVHFAGARPHAECLAAIRTAGIVALPCRTATNGDKDGIPVVLMEAMAASRAVVAGDLPSIRELIEDGATGRLVPPDSDAALGAALAQLVNDPALRSRMGVAARARVADEFSDQVNWRRLTAALDLARCEVGTRPRARAANAMPAKVAA